MSLLQRLISNLKPSGPRAGRFGQTAGSARISRSFEPGTWSIVSENVQIGDRVRLGDWTTIGARTRIGDDVQFGPWAQVGADCVIGNGVVLGSHSRVADGVQIPANTRIGDNDLVTRDGVIQNRTGGSAILGYGSLIIISAPFGNFLIPDNARLSIEEIEAMVEDYRWGRADHLERFSIETWPRTDLERENAAAIVSQRILDASAPVNDF